MKLESPQSDRGICLSRGLVEDKVNLLPMLVGAVFHVMHTPTLCTHQQKKVHTVQ